MIRVLSGHFAGGQWKMAGYQGASPTLHFFKLRAWLSMRILKRIIINAFPALSPAGNRRGHPCYLGFVDERPGKMKTQYLPEYYLKGFTEVTDAEMIWLYDQQSRMGRPITIYKACADNQFDADVREYYLIREVEDPAKEVILKIRKQVLITPEEKKTLALYLILLWKRTPGRKKIMRGMDLGVMEQIKQKTYQQLEETYAAHRETEDLYYKRRAELDGLFNDQQRMQPILKDSWEETFKPEIFLMSVHALTSMNWSFWVSDDEPFVTNDNPLFFHANLGIGQEKSEVCFPVSTRVALWATWRSDIREGAFFKANRQLVQELNRRTVGNRVRSVFASSKLEWITKSLSEAAGNSDGSG